MGTSFNKILLLAIFVASSAALVTPSVLSNSDPVDPSRSTPSQDGIRTDSAPPVHSLETIRPPPIDADISLSARTVPEDVIRQEDFLLDYESAKLSDTCVRNPENI
jgi:hypothetical protein